MAWYVVSYDLRREVTSADYDRMHAALKTAADFCWPLESFWIIETPNEPSAVVNYLLANGLDDNDGIVVLEITGAGAFRRVANQTTADWLTQRLTIR